MNMLFRVIFDLLFGKSSERKIGIFLVLALIIVFAIIFYTENEREKEQSIENIEKIGDEIN